MIVDIERGVTVKKGGKEYFITKRNYEYFIGVSIQNQDEEGMTVKEEEFFELIDRFFKERF